MAVVGSAPSCLKNAPGFIDGHDLVVRINNFKTRGYERQVGARTDVYYSYFGNAVKKDPGELRRAGVKLCMCKCPDGHVIESAWHEQNGRRLGVDFRWIYQSRRGWWFCDTYVPSAERFLASFNALGRHVPTTGFACLFELLQFDCEIYATGFDFFASGKHNVDEHWRPGPSEDPIAHAPAREREWLKAYVKRHPKKLKLDETLRALLL